MNVEILSKKLITPSSPTPPHLRNHKVSWLSMFQSPLLHLPHIFYYPSRTSEDNIERSKKLQKSLSKTLTIFYPFAGRYIDDDNLILDCNDEGVEYVEAQVSGCLSQLLEGGELVTELRNRLAPIPLQPANSPIVLVQFNMFQCGGVAIGLCIKHRTTDASSAFAFVNAWATAARLGVDKVHTPSLLLPSFFPPRDIPNFIPNTDGDKKTEIQKRFVFNGAALSKLKAAVASSNINVSRQPTRVEVVTGLIWKTLTSVVQAKNGRLRSSLLSMTVNLRGKIAMPIQDNSCGNLTNIALACFTPDEDENKMELHQFVSRVNSGIRKRVEESAKISSSDDLFSSVVKTKSEMIEAFNGSDVDLYMFTSWCRMPIYEVDFSWGKPGWFSAMAVPGHNMFLLVDTEDGDGIEAWVSLEEDTMFRFQENLDIKAFTSQ